MNKISIEHFNLFYDTFQALKNINLQIKNNEIDETFLKEIMKKDKIFPDIDYMIYK